MSRNMWLVSGAAAAVMGIGLFGITRVSANGPMWGGQDMTAALAQKLGVSEDKVKTAFNEIHAERQSRMETLFEQRLNQAVSEGKLTEDKKNLILEKHKELVADREKTEETWQNMTPDERRTEMQKEKTDLANWATQNGIDLSYFFAGRHGMRGGLWMK